MHVTQLSLLERSVAAGVWWCGSVKEGAGCLPGRHVPTDALYVEEREGRYEGGRDTMFHHVRGAVEKGEGGIRHGWGGDAWWCGGRG